MSLAAGTRLGPYEILAPLGAGGMGEVYKARDTRLDRTVAIKVLPEHLSQKPQLRERFEREARAVSSLNHAHICTLHDVGQDRDVDYLVMEYLEGETLAQRLTKGPLPLDQVLRYAVEVAGALDHAHRHGVIHRDLKPSNIMLTKAGVKVLDFGLAKVLASAAAPVMTQPTNTLTEEGAILGTLQYMAPEQLEGKEADARSDIFAFGSVVYEMATGKKAFEGQSRASVIAAIMERQPPSLTTQDAMSPPTLERIVKKCMAKDQDARWQTAADLKDGLQWLREERPQANPPSKRSQWTKWLALGIAAAVSISFLWTLYLRRAPEQTPVLQLSLPEPQGGAGGVTVSPDGRHVAYVAEDGATESLWIRSLDTSVVQRLPGTEGAVFSFWSPDSRSLGFFAERKLMRVDISGGRAETLAEAPAPRGGAWNRDGVIVFAPNTTSRLYSVPAKGGVVTAVTELDPSRQENAHRFPSFLPDGRHFLFYVRSRQRENTGILVGSLGSKQVQRLLNADSTAVFAPPGYLLFIRDATLMAQRFQARELRFSGEPFTIAKQVADPGIPGRGPFSVSENGMLVFRHTRSRNIQLRWFNREGKPLEVAGPANDYTQFVLAPDQNRVALVRPDLQSASFDIWLLELKRGGLSRFTSDPLSDWFPVWSPDGARIVFASDREGVMDLYQKSASGGAKEDLFLKSNESKIPTDWSRDGRFILYQTSSSKTNSDLWLLPLEGDRKPVALVASPFDEYDATFSPDGQWIGYTSDETGRQEVYVQAFQVPGGRPVSGRWQVSISGGARLRWRGDGKELFYIAPDGKLMSVLVRNAPTFTAGVPAALFSTSLGLGGSNGSSVGYAVAGNGQRFLIATAGESEEPSPITVVINWTAGLRR